MLFTKMVSHCIIGPEYILIFKVYCVSPQMETNRIYHRPPLQTEKSQPEGKRIMPEMRLTEFPALSVYPLVLISRSASRPTFDYFSYL